MAANEDGYEKEGLQLGYIEMCINLCLHIYL